MREESKIPTRPSEIHLDRSFHNVVLVVEQGHEKAVVVQERALVHNWDKSS